MPTVYQFLVNDGSTAQEAENEAERLGLCDIYKLEDFSLGQTIIGGLAEHLQTELFSHMTLLDIQDSIDWQEQSELFSPYYKDGKIEIPLKDFSSTDAKLTLTTGGGFGDMSHPTTRLVMSLLESHVKGKTVLDIGCGNGILSFAARLLGASFVSGIDINPDALAHAEINRSLCCIDEIVISATPPEKITRAKELVCLMNMTFAEQICAFTSVKDIAIKTTALITSGILIEQRDRYLEWVKELGFSLKEEKEQDGWMAFAFYANEKSCGSYPQL